MALCCYSKCIIADTHRNTFFLTHLFCQPPAEPASVVIVGAEGEGRPRGERERSSPLAIGTCVSEDLLSLCECLIKRAD